MSDKVTRERVDEIRHQWTTPPRNYNLQWFTEAINDLLTYIDHPCAPEVETVGWGVAVLLGNGVYEYRFATDRDDLLRIAPEFRMGPADALVRRSDMETALGAKERECEELRGKVDDLKNRLNEGNAYHEKTCQRLYSSNERLATLTAEIARLNKVVEAGEKAVAAHCDPKWFIDRSSLMMAMEQLESALAAQIGGE